MKFEFIITDMNFLQIIEGGNHHKSSNNNYFVHDNFSIIRLDIISYEPDNRNALFEVHLFYRNR